GDTGIAALALIVRVDRASGSFDRSSPVHQDYAAHAIGGLVDRAAYRDVRVRHVENTGTLQGGRVAKRRKIDVGCKTSLLIYGDARPRVARRRRNVKYRAISARECVIWRDLTLARPNRIGARKYHCHPNARTRLELVAF